MAKVHDDMRRALDTLGLLEALIDPDGILDTRERGELGLVLSDLLQKMQAGIADLEEQARPTPTDPPQAAA